MDSLVLLVSGVALVMLVFWGFQHRDLKPTDKTSGIYAMRDEDDDTPPDSERGA